MFMKLIDYAGSVVEVDIGELDTIGRIDIEVITGDEVATIIYKDYTVKKFWSNHAWQNFFDDEYCVYNEIDGTNLFNDKNFAERTSSYWMWGETAESYGEEEES